MNIKGLSLKQNFKWGFLGNVIYSASQWGILIAMAKIGSAEMVGLYTLGLAISGPIQIFLNLQLRSLQVTDLKDSYKFNDYLVVRTFTSMLSMLIIILIAIFGGYNNYTKLVLIFVGLLKAVESISDLFYGLMQKHERVDYISFSKVLRGVVSLGIFSISLLYTNNLIIALLMMLLVWKIVLLIFDIRVGKKIVSVNFNFNLNNFKRILITTLPLGFAHTLSSLNTNIPRYFLEGNFGADQLGYYASIAYFIVVGDTIISSLSLSVLPRITRYINGSDKLNLKKLLLKLEIFGFVVGIVAVIGAWLLGEYILEFVYSTEFAKYNNVFVIVMVAAAFNYMSAFLGECITGFRKFRIQLILSVSWVVITLFSSRFLIPLYGIKGAAISLLISSITIFITRLFTVSILIKRM
ncbi:oligosaccharide flippase family protein [Peribacillus asahii]|uniref:oligosaccharide flippase family protein n=1 Tax=Peribacillus asahii TaxID=228899 RepID=UPI0037F3A0E6